MSIKRRILPLLLSAAMLAACGETEINEVRRSDDISFSWWGMDKRHSYTVNAVKQFVRMNPSIDVKSEYSEFSSFQKRMDAEFASHDECDVMQINYDWLFRYSPDGTGFYDLNQLADTIDLSNFTEDQLSYGMINGKLNGIANALNTQTCYYDRGMYSDYGLELPKTWDDVFAAARVMSRDGIYPLTMNKKAAWLMCIAHQEQTSGRRCYYEDGSVGFTEADFAEILTFYKRLCDEKVTELFSDVDTRELIDLKAAGLVCWISDAGSFCEPAIEQGRDIVVGDYLTTGSGELTGWYAKPTSLYCIRRDTKMPEASAKLVDFLLNSQEMAQAQGTEKGIPLSKSMLEVLEANDLLKGIQVTANDQMKATSGIKRISPCLENAVLVDSFASAATDTVLTEADIETEAKALYEAAQKAALK
ncbi:MAG: carbohydrate ABC transporter substrate-binding protein [Ruminococcus sp.]|nr:carbohydrate ABC transporter substrate-binding protein [Ruminococcus sp.]